MKRLFRFVIGLMAALLLVPFLPLYVERTMMRSLSSGGDIIDWGWQLRTLHDFWANARYFGSDQQPGFWLMVNLVLGLGYALAIALTLDWFFTRRKRHR
jgi:flagellar biogenesis protein FliO